jgi:sarcosine oxidase subunit delta
VLLLTCPWCGPRDETEFTYGGQAHVAYPAAPADLTDQAWAEYLFYRDNPKGPFAERWVHSTGCRAAAGSTAAPCCGSPSTVPS